MSGVRRLGADVEDAAARYLLAKGYTLVARRVKTRSGEIDIVALDGEVLVCVEVKFRARGAPELAVDDRKTARFHAAVEEYLAKAGGPDRPVRYDLIAVSPDELRHHEDAFRG